MRRLALIALIPLASACGDVRPSYADWEGRNFASVFDASKAEQMLDWSPVKDRTTLVREGIHVPVEEHFEL